MMGITRRIALAAAVLGLVAGMGGRGGAAIVLDFEDISIPGGTDTTLSTYSNSGFTLTATDTATGFSAGFQAHGPNSIFFAGSQALAAFAPPINSTTMITLTQDDGQPFSLLSIDLARNFAFDPAPTVTFVGTKAGGGSVTETFTITTPPGTAAFQPFDFSGFTDLTSVTWGQPQLAAGLHQFDDIRLEPGTAAVPEPSTFALTGLMTLAGLGYAWRRRRAAA